MNELKFVSDKLEGKQYKWLVTGCAGFIGSNIIKFLLENNQLVVGLDNFATGFQHNLDEIKGLVTADKWNNFKFIEGDIRDLDTCLEASKEADYVLHQGALGSVPRSIKDPITSNNVNLNGTLNMFVAARDNGIKRVVFASSSSVYGDDTNSPKLEEKVGNPLSPYAITKKGKELYAKVFSEQYGLEIIGLRYFNVFGPRQNPNGPYAAVIPKWVEAMIKNKPVAIFGDGETSRDFTYIDNVIALNVLSAISENSIPAGTILNGALGDTTSLNDLFEKIRVRLAQDYPHLKDFKVSHQDFRPGDIRHSLADISKAKNLVGYKPLVDINKGLDKALKWYCENLIN